MFDFGGPVLRTPFELRAVGEREAGLPPGSFGWTGPFDVEADADWREFQGGAINEREYWARRVAEFSAALGRPADMKAMMGCLYGGTEAELVRPGAVALLREAKAAGIPVGALTNDLTSFHDAAWIERIGVIAEFDVLVDGRQEGVYKPDARAYEIVLERLGVPAAGTVFLDDQPVNLRGAERVGMTPVFLDVRAPEAGFDEVRSLLALA